MKIQCKVRGVHLSLMADKVDVALHVDIKLANK